MELMPGTGAGNTSLRGLKTFDGGLTWASPADDVTHRVIGEGFRSSDKGKMVKKQLFVNMFHTGRRKALDIPNNMQDAVDQH